MMPPRLLLFCLLALSPHLVAADAAARWEGAIQIPGRELRLILDLAQDSRGEWIGSAILPDLGIKGARLTAISVDDGDVSFAIKGALADPKLTGRVTGDRFTGDFHQGGNIARFALRSAGPPQVDLPRQSTPVRKELEGEWQGDMDFLGRPIHVKLTLSGATATLTLTGRRETVLPADLVTLDADNLTIQVTAAGMTFEGRSHAGRHEIAGTFQQGPVETSLVLHR